MQKQIFTVKQKIIYAVFICVTVFVLLLGNEGKRPLTYEGTMLQHSVGEQDAEGNLIITDMMARSGNIASTPQYIMNRGTYTAKVVYEAEEEGSVLELWEQGNKIAGWPMNADTKEASYEYTLSKDAKQLQFRINYGGQGKLTVKSLSITPATIFYSDSYYMVALFLLFNVLGVLLYRRHLKKPIAKETLTDWCIIVGVSLFAMSPMFLTYLYNGDDLCYHLARLEGLKDGILDGQIPVHILPDGLQGNGYLNTMYPYLFLYVGAFLRICRVSIALSYKTIIFLTNLGSAVAAYYAVRSMTKSRRSVILAVVLYTLMPYRFTNIFSRGDLGEILALVFWPLVIAGMYHLTMGDRKKWYYLAIGFSGALQSHILSAVFVGGFCLITALVYIGKIIKEKRYVEIGKAAGMFILVNLWYIVPFLYYYFGENLNKEILRWSSYFEQSINLSNMTQSISLYNKQYFSLGLAIIGCIGIGVVYLLCEYDKEREEINGFLCYLLVLGVILVVLTTGYAPNRVLFENEFFKPIVTMIQFPWRFLGPACACFVFVGAASISKSAILKPYRDILFALLIGLNLLVAISVPTDNNHMPYSNDQAVASKGHESKFASNIGVFYPHEWRIVEASSQSLTTSVVVSDLNRIVVENYQKKGTKASVTYVSTTDDEYIELPIQSYRGYRAKDENGKKVEIKRGDAARIRLAVIGDGMKHTVYVQYGPIPIFIVANLISAITWILIGVWQYGKHRNRKTKLS